MQNSAAPRCSSLARFSFAAHGREATAACVGRAGAAVRFAFVRVRALAAPAVVPRRLLFGRSVGTFFLTSVRRSRDGSPARVCRSLQRGKFKVQERFKCGVGPLERPHARRRFLWYRRVQRGSRTRGQRQRARRRRRRPRERDGRPQLSPARARVVHSGRASWRPPARSRRRLKPPSAAPHEPAHVARHRVLLVRRLLAFHKPEDKGGEEVRWKEKCHCQFNCWLYRRIAARGGQSQGTRSGAHERPQRVRVVERQQRVVRRSSAGGGETGRVLRVLEQKSPGRCGGGRERDQRQDQEQQ